MTHDYWLEEPYEKEAELTEANRLAKEKGFKDAEDEAKALEEAHENYLFDRMRDEGF